MAGSGCASVLQLSRDAGSGHDLHRGDDYRGVVAVARTFVHVAMDSLGADAFRAAAIHREYRGMDDRGTGTPAVADLPIDADLGGDLAARVRRKCAVYP